MINWLNILLAGIISGIIAIIVYNSYKFIRSHFTYRKYKGKYDVYLKRDEELQEGEPVEIYKVCGNRIHVKRKHKNISESKGIIIMSHNVPNYGTGNYHHNDIKDGWGNWNVQIYNEQFLVDVQYQAKFTEHNPSYVWRKVKD